MLNELHEAGLMTHMPFLTPGESGKPVLLFCQADASRIWKLYAQTSDGRILRLSTGMPEDVCECSPTAWHDGTGWHMSFIAGGGKPNPLHRLYRMDGPALHQLGQPVSVQATRAGFVYRDRLVHAEMDNLVHVRQPTGDFDIELPGAFIYRVAYRADRPDTLLISGQWQTEDDAFTLEYDLTSGEQSMIECDGYPAYKCTILGDQMLYAQRIGEQFEHRRVTAAKSVASVVRRQAGQVQPIATQPMGNCGCRDRSAPGGPMVTRASCLECVEKHLGAAYVLLTETRDGYAHRLRAIGHLHEAEDESQEWPELHNAIRAARKAYQIDGTMPDWETLAKTSKAVRTSIR
jgi:hypothetical protein